MAIPAQGNAIVGPFRDSKIRLVANPVERRIRARFGGQWVADSRGAKMVFHKNGRPNYYFPKADLKMELLEATADVVEDERGKGTVHHLRVGDRVAEKAATVFEGELDGMVVLKFGALDAWFEEDQPLYHAVRSPHHRVDNLRTQREIRVEVDGVEVARSRNGVICYETGLIPRYYIPQTDVRMDLLDSTDLVTHCQYKGSASYWSVNVAGETHENIVWGYRSPFPESAPLKDLVAFYNEKVDTFVDGVKQPRPRVGYYTKKVDLREQQKAPDGVGFIDVLRRVRAFNDDRVVVDSRQAKLVYEKGSLPRYWFPKNEVLTTQLEAAGTKTSVLGELQEYTWKGKDRVVARSVKNPAPGVDLKDHYQINWKAVDSWFEEDEEVFVHPRDPFHRVDTFQSSQEVRVEVDGVEVARSNRPIILQETGLPTRYYLPRVDVDLTKLTGSDLQTSCPYKGTASYWSVQVNGSTHENIVWGYPTPITQAATIRDLVCFYNEKVDIIVDGVKQERPISPFS